MKGLTKITARTKVPEADVLKFKGLHAREAHYDVLLTGDVNVYGPDGSMLFGVRRGALDEELVDNAYDALHWLRRMKTDNRASYSGGERYKRVKEDGTLTNTTWSKLVASATIGYYDRYPRIPYCRQTAFIAKHPEKWNTIVPLLQNIAKHYKRNVPAKYMSQMGIVAETEPEWVIPKTPFTTITVNNCTCAAYHTDRGDYKGGFGVMAVLRRGEYRGAELVLPEYKIAVDLGHRDLIFFDPHLWHGNVPIYDAVGEESKEWERISIVCYFRENMKDCLCMAEEIERANRLAGEIEDADTEGEPEALQ